MGNYQAGLLAGDGDAVCEQLTGEAARLLISGLDYLAEGDECPAAIEKIVDLAGDDELATLNAAHIRLDDSLVRFDGSSAMVDVPDGPTLKLERIEGRWYITDTNASDFRILPTSDEVKRCFEDSGAFGVEIVDVADAASLKVPLVLGIGPSGGRIGILLGDNPRITQGATSGLRKEFEIQYEAGNRAAIIGDGASEDVSMAEGCLQVDEAS